MYSAYLSGSCTGPSIYSAIQKSDCGTSADDDRMRNDDYVPPVVQPPPSVATTAYPTSLQGTPHAFIAYCPVQMPTRKPTFKPSAFPTQGSAKTVDILATLVSIFFGQFLFSAPRM